MTVPIDRLPFRAVNRRGTLGHNSGLQRHHLIPRQALKIGGLKKMLSSLGERQVGFHDFRRNGMLLPWKEPAAIRLSLPLHRGPHRAYNDMVLERLGMIEQSWSYNRGRHSERANQAALLQISLLQGALRRRLLNTERPMLLNSKDPLGKRKDFALLDTMAEQLWKDTQLVQAV